jgi:hypothetical protein
MLGREQQSRPGRCKGQPVRQFTTWQRNKHRRPRASGPRHWLVLLLILAISASGFLHVVSGSHEALAASHSLDPASLSQDAYGEPNRSNHDGEPHGTVCSMASSCSFYVPVTLSTVPARTNGEPAYMEPEADHSGLAPTPHARPPKLFANV